MDWNYKSELPESTGYEDLYPVLSKYTSDVYNNSDDVTKEKMIEEVTSIYAERNIFPIKYFNEEGIKQEIKRGIDYVPVINGDVVNTGAGVCTSLCNFFMPNLFEAYNITGVVREGNGSASFKFHNRDYLKKCVRFALQCDGSALPHSIMAGIRQAGVMPSNFRPMNAKALYEHYCPENGVIHDSSCVDDETEFFTGSGWKSVKDYEVGDKVLQYNEDGSAELVNPIRYIHYKSNEPFYLYRSKRGVNSCLTGNHVIVYRKRIHDTKSLTEKLFRVTQKEILNKDFRGRIPLSFNYSGNYEIDENLLRLAIAIQADGRILTDGSVDYVEMRVSKDRKIKRFRNLLSRCNIEISKKNVITFTNDKYKDCVGFYFHSKELCDIFREGGDVKDKNFPNSWWNFSKRMKEIVMDEVSFWDGYANDGAPNYSNTNKHNVDMIQFFFVSTGHGSSCHVEDRRHIKGREKCKVCYYVRVRDSIKYGAYKKEKGFTEVYKEDKYCFEVPSHNLVLRRNNIVFVTGNCGFGGRLTGALTSKKNFSYIGTEPNSVTYENLYKLGHAIESVTGRKGSFKIIKLGSEVFRANPEIFDFSFSSVPYFSLEQYSNEPTQCYIKFPDIYQWIDGFVKPTIENTYYMLKHERYYAINISDFKYENRIVNYVDIWCDLSQKAGFKYLKDLFLKIPKRAGSNKRHASEGKKERIMIFYKE